MKLHKKLGYKIARKGFKASQEMTEAGKRFISTGVKKTIAGGFVGLTKPGVGASAIKQGVENVKAGKFLLKMSRGTKSATRFLAKGGAIGLATAGALATGGLVASKLRKRKRVIGKSKFKER